MVSMRNLAFAASAFFGLAAAAPTELATRQFTPGLVNNTQEFYISLLITDGTITKYNGWQLEAWHTGAGSADPVFVQGTGSRAFLNGTNLQFDTGFTPFAANGFPSDTNYARWEPVTINAGYGSGPWINEASAGLQVGQEEHDGWIVCEWVHGYDAPQLFQMIKGFDSGEGYGAFDVPSSCGRALLFPVFI